MLLDFMTEDKEFQRELRRRTESGAQGRGAREAEADTRAKGSKGAAGAANPTF
jgi:hypothetical protein